MSYSKELPSLRQKVTGGALPWGAERSIPGQQAGAALVAGATNVAPSQPWLRDKW
jgi:hypothetical protein